jgi:hypothetical protein
MLTKPTPIKIMAGATALLLTSVVLASVASAAAYRIRNTGGAGVAFRNSPRSADKKAPIHGAPEGAAIEVVCQDFGDPVGPRSNRVWDKVIYAGETAWIPDTYTSTPQPANQFTPGVPRCGSATTAVPGGMPNDSAAVTGAFAQARDRVGRAAVGRSSNGVHRWGAGNAQDFDRGTFGWNIIMQADGNPSAFVVRTGFWDYYRTHGGPTTFGFPTSDEYPVAGGANQQFTRVTLAWSPSTGVTVASALNGPGSFPNGAVADRATNYLGQRRAAVVNGSTFNAPGQCVMWVKTWLAEAGANVWNFGAADEYTAYTNAGARPISLNEARRGDVLQLTQTSGRGWNYGVHTVVVLSNNGNGHFSIIQGNAPGADGAGTWRSDSSGLVTTIADWTPTSASGFEWKAWRFGKIG